MVRPMVLKGQRSPVQAWPYHHGGCLRGCTAWKWCFSCLCSGCMGNSTQFPLLLQSLLWQARCCHLPTPRRRCEEEPSLLSGRKSEFCSGFLPFDKAQMIHTGKEAMALMVAFRVVRASPEHSRMGSYSIQIPLSLNQISDSQHSPLFPLHHRLSETRGA